MDERIPTTSDFAHITVSSQLIRWREKPTHELSPLLSQLRYFSSTLPIKIDPCPFSFAFKMFFILFLTGDRYALLRVFCQLKLLLSHLDIHVYVNMCIFTLKCTGRG